MQNVRRILILFAHPVIRRSRWNRRLAAAIRGLEGVSFHDLYEAYPEFDIDVDREQRLLEEHDVVVFQHPFYWYSTPAILKEWQDLVLEHGWAYGQGGDALRGKWLVSAITAGGSEDSYRPGGTNEHSMRQFLAPIRQMAKLCGMTYLPPFVVHGTHRLDDALMQRHASDYRKVVEALRDGGIDADAVAELPRLNSDLSVVIGV